MKKLLLSGTLVVLIIIALCLAGEVANDYQNRRWDGVNRFTLIILGEKNHKTQVLSIDPETKQSVRITLPEDLEMTTVSGKGVWKIKSVVALASKNGPGWAADSIATYLGIPYTAVREKIGVWDKISWWNLSRNADWQDLSLADTALVSESYAPDGDKVLSLTKRWQDKAGDLFYSSYLAKEELKAEVYNTTDVIGVAAKVAQILENAGVKVTRTDQSDLNIGWCVVMSLKESEGDPGIKWIKNYFGCEWNEQPGMGAKEVKIFFGSDYAAWLNG